MIRLSHCTAGCNAVNYYLYEIQAVLLRRKIVFTFLGEGIKLEKR